MDILTLLCNTRHIYGGCMILPKIFLSLGRAIADSQSKG
uniref:NIT1 n=1 Tax=Arundo donax TaxID=35708 RepID=A0A0A9ELL7_ARUDO